MKNREKLFISLSSSAEKSVNFCSIVVGRICSAYGVLGWMKIVSFTEKIDNIIGYQPWYVKLFSTWHYLYLEDWKLYNDIYFIVKCKNIYDRDTARSLSNHKIFVDVLQLPDLDQGEYYWKDIIGCRVIGILGYQFGKVNDIIETGANDVLVVKHEVEKRIVSKIYLIPFIRKEVIRSVNFSDGVINVDWDPEF